MATHAPTISTPAPDRRRLLTAGTALLALAATGGISRAAPAAPPVPSPMAARLDELARLYTGDAPHPDAELVALRFQLGALAQRYSAMPESPDGSPEDRALDAVMDEIEATIRRAGGIPATTLQGLAAKGWIVMGYDDWTVTDRVVQSLCWDLQRLIGLVGAA